MKTSHLNVGGIICLLVGIYCIYSLLLNDTAFPWSICSVEGSLSHWLRHWRVLVVGLMPIYVAFTLFGAASVSLFVGSVLQDWLVDLIGTRRINN
jgi:hypothetical protein